MQRNQKPTKIKAWPELIDYLPSLAALREAATSQKSSVEIDFGSVRSVSSTGVAVFLLRLLRFLGKRAAISIQCDCPYSIRHSLEELNVFAHLNTMVGKTQGELPIKEERPEPIKAIGRRTFSSPVYRLAFDKGVDRRKSLKPFRTWLSKQFSHLEQLYSVETNGLVMLISEIAKNTADHANEDGLFGMDIIPIDDKRGNLVFAFGDLGIGIKQHIERNLPKAYQKRRAHMSLYEAYKLALTPGYTSSKSGMNAGHGMSIIIDCATALRVNLSIFDAASRGLLNYVNTHKLSHASIRRIFHSVGHDVGFFYFGECTFKKIDHDEN